MTVFKCKMCGSPLDVAEGAGTATCEYCHTRQTLPRLDDERRANLYDRGNHFRRAGEYDKAMRAFEAVLAEDPSDAEAYWSIVLCRYGVEYAEDPATGRRVPTVNRMQSSSILADGDYKKALENADALQRGIYEDQAREIARIQEGIAEVAAKEEPFDVFICYKEAGSDGVRTRDSVKAAELYHALASEGFRVFYAPVTLEDKLGQAYEPYIYSALQSAPVMVAIGSKPEHFSSPWVRNEWSRYLALIKAGAKKTLIPAYFGMDPYDLPEEFAHLQAQDMSKIGFLQDLVRGIKKVCGRDERQAAARQAAAQQGTLAGCSTFSAPAASGGAAPLLKRAKMFLADGEWDRAEEYAERVLDIDPVCAEAYLVKEMRAHRCRTFEELAEKRGIGFFGDGLYQKAAKFATGDSAKVMAQVRAAALAKQFEVACDAWARAESAPLSVAPEMWFFAAQQFERAEEHPGASDRARECREREAEANRLCATNDGRIARAREEIAALAPSRGEGYVDFDGSLEAEYERVRGSISDLADWRGTDEVFAACDKGVRLARQSVADDRAMKAKEQVEKANEVFRTAGLDSAGSVEAEFARIKASLSDVGEWASVKTVMKECDEGVEECRRAVRGSQIRRRKMLIAISIAAAVVILVALYAFFIRPAMLRSQAAQLEAKGSYSEAVAIYEELGLDEESGRCSKAMLSAAKVGETVAFGSYEQDGNMFDGAEAIEWIVLDRRDSGMLLISKYALDCRAYNDRYEDVTWEMCTLRSWLNGEFLETAFSANERALIARAKLSNPDNEEYGTEGGDDTSDSVFLLSIDEVTRYFSSDDDRICYPTEYAVAQGTWTSDEGTCFWWLRSPGNFSGSAAGVSSDGSAGSLGWYVGHGDRAVRPALWVNW